MTVSFASPLSARFHDLVPAALRRAWAAEGHCPDLDLYALFRARRMADRDAIAVIDAHGEVSYAELDHQARCRPPGSPKRASAPVTS